MNLKTPIAPITFSKKAIAEIKRLMKEKGFDKTKKFRVGIKNNNNELSYIFCFDNQREDDVLYKAKDVTLIMKESDSIYLQGLEVDYINDLNKKGFILIKPKTTKINELKNTFIV